VGEGLVFGEPVPDPALPQDLQEPGAAAARRRIEGTVRIMLLLPTLRWGGRVGRPRFGPQLERPVNVAIFIGKTVAKAGAESTKMNDSSLYWHFNMVCAEA
jgi:hypothetical protein